MEIYRVTKGIYLKPIKLESEAISIKGTLKPNEKFILFENIESTRKRNRNNDTNKLIFNLRAGKFLWLWSGHIKRENAKKVE